MMHTARQTAMAGLDMPRTVVAAVIIEGPLRRTHWGLPPDRFLNRVGAVHPGLEEWEELAHQQWNDA